MITTIKNIVGDKLVSLAVKNNLKDKHFSELLKDSVRRLEGGWMATDNRQVCSSVSVNVSQHLR